jgi:GNAT superfamily N-acetyltransferase
MQIQEIDLKNRNRVRDFLSLPFSIYREIPQWVPPLQMDERGRLNPRKFPYYKHSEAAFFLACDGAKAVGRLAILNNRPYNEFNNERTAFFYLFECENRTDAAQGLFEAGFEWARARGLKKILGPKGFTPMDGFGLLVKGFQHRPAFGLPYNPEYYVRLIESCGFKPHRDAVSGYLDETIQFPERIHELAERIQQRRGLHIARYERRSDLRTLVPKLKDLYNGALRGTAGNAPISDEEANALAGQMLWFADPKLVKIVMKDKEPVGFLLAYPNVSAALQRTKGRLFPFGWLVILRELRRADWLDINGAGLIPEYRGTGGMAILYSEMFKTVKEGGRFRRAEVVQIGMENDAMQRDLENFGIDFYKTHRTYMREL